MTHGSHKVLSIANQTAEENIRAAVDQMIQQLPPSLNKAGKN
jgi:hypothetical protein